MTAQTFDLLITGGLVIDGTGLPRRRIDVGVKDGRVTAFGHLKGAHSTREIDATGHQVGLQDPRTLIGNVVHLGSQHQVEERRREVRVGADAG